MRFHFLLTVTAVSALALCSACSNTRTSTANRSITNDDVEKNVKARYQLDPQLKAYDVDVDADVNDNKITISGNLPSEDLRQKAVSLARESGPNMTITDKIDVKPGEVDRAHYTEDMARDARTRANTSGEKIGDNTDDAWIHTKIRTKLVGSGELPFGGINVDVNNHVVTLRGSVDNAQTKAEAERIARETDGVSKVNNQLVVKRKG